MVQVWFESEAILPQWVFLIDYTRYGFLVGVLLGLGMTLGELPNSFLKRQFDIPPGRSRRGFLGIVFFIYDQVDLTIGIWLLLFSLVRPSLFMVLWSILLTLLLHVAVSIIGYLLKMRKTIF